MNFKDRGNKKWTAMMPVEHRKKLKELKEHEDYREKPILDDQEKEAINSKLQKALQNNMNVEIRYYEDKKIKKTSGRINKVDINNRVIWVNDIKIPFENLLEVKLG
ncbi:MAG: YolD-like family protein [Candidatus Woesearchaeota archaeon]